MDFLEHKYIELNSIPSNIPKIIKKKLCYLLANNQ